MYVFSFYWYRIKSVFCWVLMEAWWMLLSPFFNFFAILYHRGNSKKCKASIHFCLSKHMIQHNFIIQICWPFHIFFYSFDGRILTTNQNVKTEKFRRTYIKIEIEGLCVVFIKTYFVTKLHPNFKNDYDYEVCFYRSCKVRYILVLKCFYWRLFSVRITIGCLTNYSKKHRVFF